mgnify:CR=1 FL=1|tara:strand:- start:618 stop:920 length:303 start_codon:yes stop_codon:yes gene_type:complete
MALKGELTHKGITIGEAHAVIVRAIHYADYSAEGVKTLSAQYLVKFYKDEAVYNADPNNNYDQKEFIFTPSVANTAGQNLVRQSYNNMKTLSDYDSMTDV